METVGGWGTGYDEIMKVFIFDECSIHFGGGLYLPVYVFSREGLEMRSRSATYDWFLMLVSVLCFAKSRFSHLATLSVFFTPYTLSS